MYIYIYIYTYIYRCMCIYIYIWLTRLGGSRCRLAPMLRTEDVPCVSDGLRPSGVYYILDR